MTLAMQRRLVGLIAVAIAGTSLWWVSRADLEKAMVYYLTPTELIASAHARSSTFRLGGMVKAGSLDWDREAQHASRSYLGNGQMAPGVHQAVQAALVVGLRPRREARVSVRGKVALGAPRHGAI